MKPYIIKLTTENPYAAVVVNASTDSVFLHWAELEKDLKQESIQGKILIDCLLHTGNSKERFFEVMIDNSLDQTSAKCVVLDRKNYFRRLSSDILASYPQIVNNSILNEYQKKLVLHKVCL